MHHERGERAPAGTGGERSLAGGGVRRCGDCEAAHHETMEELRRDGERPPFPPDPDSRRAVAELVASANGYNAAVQFMRQSGGTGEEASAAANAADARVRFLGTSWVWRAPLAAVPRRIDYAPPPAGDSYAALADFADAGDDVPGREIPPDAA